jgi:hypothetical protein
MVLDDIVDSVILEAQRSAEISGLTVRPMSLRHKGSGGEYEQRCGDGSSAETG